MDYVEKKYNKEAAVGAVLFHALLLLLLWFLAMAPEPMERIPPEKYELTLAMDFGNEMQGSTQEDASTAEVTDAADPAEDVVTDDIESEDQVVDGQSQSGGSDPSPNDNAMADASTFGNNNGGGDGTGGAGDAGNPLGEEGTGSSLNGRTILTRAADCFDEGKIQNGDKGKLVLSIWVDPSGKVTRAEKHSSSTVHRAALVNHAINAVKSCVTFNEDLSAPLVSGTYSIDISLD